MKALLKKLNTLLNSNQPFFPRDNFKVLVLFSAIISLQAEAQNLRLPSTSGISLVQRTAATGVKGNFELILSSRYGGLQHWTRKNSSAGNPWEQNAYFSSGFSEGVSVIESSYKSNEKNTLNVVVSGGGYLTHYLNDNGNQENNWSLPDTINIEASGSHKAVQGAPCMIQSSYGSGSNKNFEVVVPLKSGGMMHYYRDNGSEQQWVGGGTLGTEHNDVKSVTFFENQGYNKDFDGGDSDGNFELVALSQSNLYHYYREKNDNQFQWNSNPPAIPNTYGAYGIAGFVQTENDKNFHLVFPYSDGDKLKYRYLYRDNSKAPFTWHKVGDIVVSDATEIKGISLIESSYGNLEIQVQTDHGIQSYYTAPEQLPNSATFKFCQEPIQGSPQTKGLWTIPYTTGVVGIATAMLNTNKVLFFDYGPDQDDIGTSAVLDLATGMTTKLTNTDKNLFCSGLSFLKDGTLLTVGGHGTTSVKSVFTFDPSSGTNGKWKSENQMTVGRWYPTCTTLPSGDSIFAISGTITMGNTFDFKNCHKQNELNKTYQIISYGSSGVIIGSNESASGILDNFGSCESKSCESYSLYPFSYVLPNGKLFLFGKNSSLILTDSSGTWKVDKGPYITNSKYPRIYPVGGSSVLLPLGSGNSPTAKVMVFGGAGGKVCAQDSLKSTTSGTNTSEIINADSTTWESKASMNKARVMPDAVLLPNQKVLAVNGSTNGYADDMVYPVYEGEIYDQSQNTWTTMNKMRVPRLYHSTAILLPDATVLTAGKGKKFNKEPYKYSEIRGEVFYPPYLFKSNGDRRTDDERPRIQSAPASLTFNEQASLTIVPKTGTGQQTIDWEVVLIAPGAVTHAFNMHQRLVVLSSSATASGSNVSLSITAPPTKDIAPKGYYMLFVLQDGVPSEAKWVALE